MAAQTETLLWAQKIGDKLRERRKLLGLSLENLSRLSGSTVPTLSHIERGTRDVKLSTLVSMAAALRIDLSELFVENRTTHVNREPQSGAVGYDLDDD
ncbi:helix-turn-helix transcriptional regulator [Ruegeria pomeroyi]|uniref:helix-turn-helix domain-containing protein n=1 Tax=Ruegeria pomeroyi TaxID=89184 RepID=UPI001F2CD6D0|nr:helix-turn-helix transcriptional regulator [Ruegeria pomeroyi]MCE8509211.1 helix-turn-helix transcriptional regulator [Ruegeria pomeroyi]